MADITRSATAVWNGTLLQGSGTFTVGSGAIPEQAVSWPARTEEPGGKTSPEELLAAAQASCLAMEIAAQVEKDQAKPVRQIRIAFWNLSRLDTQPTLWGTTDAERWGALDAATQRLNEQFGHAGKPALMTGAIFLHEGFLLLWAPTLLAMMLLLWSLDRSALTPLVSAGSAAAGIAVAFYFIYVHGTPSVPYEEFVQLVQSRADFRVTELSLKECYFRATDHVGLTLPYFTDPGAMLNLGMALLVLSPMGLILGTLWRRAIANAGAVRWAVVLLLLGSVSGLALFPIATDFGRWLSAITFCNMFAVFLLVRLRVLHAEDLSFLSHGSFPYLFLLLFSTYVLFGPLHDWMPYPYQDRPVVSALVVMAILTFDVAFLLGRPGRPARRDAGGGSVISSPG